MNENSYIFDGVLSNSPLLGRSYFWGNQEGTEEIQVSLLGASAEYAVAQGGVFNIVSKEGGNTFSGTLMGTWYPDSLTSKPIKAPCRCPLGETGYTIDHYRDYQAYLGGPIVRDRLWFYGGITSEHSSTFSPGSNPEPPPPAPFYADHRPLLKVTWRTSDNVTIKGGYWDERWSSVSSARR